MLFWAQSLEYGCNGSDQFRYYAVLFPRFFFATLPIKISRLLHPLHAFAVDLRYSEHTPLLDAAVVL